MSKFHESVRQLLEDINKFLQGTLQNEVLSTTALTHKESLLMKLNALSSDYPQLHLNLKDVWCSSAKVNRTSDVSSQPSSPPPYVDMNGTNYARSGMRFEYVCSDAVQEENYDTCLSDKSSNAESSSLRAEDEGDRDFPVVPAADLHTCEKNGYLEKKGRERLGFLNPFQRRWCAIRDGVMYYYEKSTDRRQRGTIPLPGYQARPFSGSNKDSKKNNFCFELVCPGKRTYQFTATSSEDVKQWIAAVERNNIPASLPEVKSSAPEDRCNQKHLDSGLSDSEDIYELVEEEKNLSDFSSFSEQEQQLYDEGQSLVESELTEIKHGNDTTNETFNYQEWYVGLWDCIADEPNELRFSRGDLIRIVSKEYDSHAWWVGEKQGQIGFVPKSYLMEAYEVC